MDSSVSSVVSQGVVSTQLDNVNNDTRVQQAPPPPQPSEQQPQEDPDSDRGHSVNTVV